MISFYHWLVRSSALIFITSCASLPQYAPNPLVDKILKPRQSFTGLTNRFCATYNDKNECLEWTIEEYDLKEEETRKTLNKLGFICNVAGRRYKVCMDLPGLCRITYKKKFWTKDERKQEYLPVEGYQFLIDANTKCFSKDKYPFE